MMVAGWLVVRGCVTGQLEVTVHAAVGQEAQHPSLHAQMLKEM